MQEFIEFVVTLRTNNWSIPVLVGLQGVQVTHLPQVGADFNMDMRNFDLSDQPELGLVPYRCGGGGGGGGVGVVGWRWLGSGGGY